jgi:hypothetical protein
MSSHFLFHPPAKGAARPTTALTNCDSKAPREGVWGLERCASAGGQSRSQGRSAAWFLEEAKKLRRKDRLTFAKTGPRGQRLRTLIGEFSRAHELEEGIEQIMMSRIARRLRGALPL